MSHIIKLKRLKFPKLSQQSISNERTLTVNNEMRIIADDTYLNEVEKWSYFNHARRISDEEASLAYAEMRISKGE